MTSELQFDHAHTAYRAGDFHQALRLLNGLPLDTPASLVLMAQTLGRLDHHAEAAQAYRQAAASGGADADTLMLRAAECHFRAGEDEEAQLIGLRLFRVLPDDPALAFLLASLFLKSGEQQLVDAVKNRLVASDDPEHLRLAMRLIGDDLFNDNNLELFSRLRALSPQDDYLRHTLIGFAREFCAYPVLEREEALLKAEIARGNITVLAAETPHYNLMWCGDEALNRLAGNSPDTTAIDPAIVAARRAMPHVWASRLRIGYVSSDFWDDHATMRLLQGVLEAHDTDRFEITLFCLTPERFAAMDGGGRQRWGRIVRIEALDDAAAEAEIRRHDIDILVDLKGNTGGARPALFNRMAAPVQVAWLGFPGSGLSIACDYIIGDRIVLPDTSAPHYHETFCRLPDTYQPNDPVHRPLPAKAPRAALGLPDEAFVMAAFNSSRKVGLYTIDLWIRVLQRVPGSVLWLMCGNDKARGFISQRIAAAGLGPDRLVFAQKTAYAAHIARVQAADIGLDTFPCNGHTTTSDTLWAGVPVVTMEGSNFASRVSESLLRAADLEELVAKDEDGFIALVASLAADKARLSGIRDRLANNRFPVPLVAAERFCRHLEAAFEAMAARARKGLAPAPIDVPALPARTRHSA